LFGFKQACKREGIARVLFRILPLGPLGPLGGLGRCPIYKFQFVLDLDTDFFLGRMSGVELIAFFVAGAMVLSIVFGGWS